MIRNNRTEMCNLLIFCIFDFLWAISASMVYLPTIISSFYLKATDNNLYFGVVQIVSNVAIVVQILPRYLGITLHRKKYALIGSYALVGVGYALLGFFVGRMGDSSNDGILVVSLMIFLLIFAAMQIANVYYYQYVRQLFDDRMIGRLYGIKNFFAGAGSLTGVALTYVILHRYVWIQNYVRLFLIAGMIFTLASVVIFMTNNKNPKHDVDAIESKREKLNLKSLLGKKNRRVIAISTLLYGYMPILNIAMTYLVESKKVHIDPTLVTSYSFISQMVLSILVGFLLDKYAKKKIVCLYLAILFVGTTMLYFFGHTTYALYYLLIGSLPSIAFMITVNLVTTMSEGKNKTDILIMTNIISLVMSSIVTFIVSYCIQTFHSYSIILILIMVLVVATIWVVRQRFD